MIPGSCSKLISLKSYLWAGNATCLQNMKHIKPTRTGLLPLNSLDICNAFISEMHSCIDVGEKFFFIILLS